MALRVEVVGGARRRCVPRDGLRVHPHAMHISAIATRSRGTARV